MEGSRVNTAARVKAVREGERGREQIFVYELSEQDLGAGSSLGNDKCWVTSKATGAIEQLFSLDIGRAVAGAVNIRYSTAQHGVRHRSDSVAGTHQAQVPFCGPETRVQLEETRHGRFRLHPAYQRKTFELVGGLEVSETLFVPHTPQTDPVAVYQLITVRNKTVRARSVRVFAYANLRGGTAGDIVGKFDDSLGALLARNESEPDWVRIFGFNLPATAYMTTHDVNRAYDPVNVLPLTNDLSARGTIFGVVQVDLEVAPGEEEELAVILVFSPEGEALARETFAAARDFRRAFQETLEHYRAKLSISQLATPDPIINQGVQWAKANMLRVMGDYPVARAFTNEPGVSSNVVIRDLAWFVYGCDWLDPSFSRDMLRVAARMRYPTGKLAEFFNAIDGRIEDYGLNINDDTPLFVLAVGHHYHATGDLDFLREIFPTVEMAIRYILSQRDSRGLIFCTARGENVWGIASWRNVIPDYSINGAVTELNSLCYGALREAAHLARAIERDELSAELDQKAEELKRAINEHLINPDNGMYYLNIDADGNRHTDVTSDEVSPVMFKVAPEAVAFRIISRLNGSDFWTEAGLRTVSRHSPYYDPSKHVGLLGGVWPGVVFWYAFAAAKYHPEAMIRGLHDGYRAYLSDPRKNNTVPGQFSEWFDGESLVNRGMRLSPWEPPRYLWAALEGLAGVNIEGGQLQIEPRLPPDWKWLALRNLPYCGRAISFVIVREGNTQRIYATEPLASQRDVTVCGQDVSDGVEVWSDLATVIAFAQDGQLYVFIGNNSSRTLIVPFELGGLIEDNRTYKVHTFSSEYGGWVESGESAGRELTGLAASIEPQGFFIIRFQLK
ncbi:MGH1-like glycoside hydrolase domain-containing protein [Pyrinomonas methylaliphatogenes]|uniref:Glycogen debranching enzyme n=1 Tax=Pyrinomonas methylaliphatogenes TaxID=454194 RepID=A0A0B6WYX1_9BACT|nr:GH116 family glycosyl hydrolase [Pyrinomonas methylaliphatogenes]CDM65355.1 glycogen debranching enzyme [Pyrinomonas methylaliphatogenes]